MSPLAIFSGPYALIAKWAVIAALALACMAFGAAKMHQHDGKEYDALNTRFLSFAEQVRLAGVEAKRKADAQIAADKVNKEKADAENLRSTAALHADIERMRNARSGGGLVPPASPGTSRPELACFDRTELERALRAFDTGIQGLVDEGSQATIDLNTAKGWAAH